MGGVHGAINVAQVRESATYRIMRRRPIQPECILTQLCFEGLGRRAVVGRFDGGRLTTDGGVLLLRQVDRRFRVTERLAGCFRDHPLGGADRAPSGDLVAQWVLGLAAGARYSRDRHLLVVEI